MVSTVLDYLYYDNLKHDYSSGRPQASVTHADFLNLRQELTWTARHETRRVQCSYISLEIDFRELVGENMAEVVWEIYGDWGLYWGPSVKWAHFNSILKSQYTNSSTDLCLYARQCLQQRYHGWIQSWIAKESIELDAAWLYLRCMSHTTIYLAAIKVCGSQSLWGIDH